mgnify:CR=1 FL=1
MYLPADRPPTNPSTPARIKRDSALLHGYKRERDAVAALDEAWDELKALGALALVKKAEQRGARAKLEDVTYTLFPSREFSAEQKAANRRQSDARLAGTPLQQHPANGQQSLRPLLDQTHDARSLASLVDKARRKDAERGE